MRLRKTLNGAPLDGTTRVPSLQIEAWGAGPGAGRARAGRARSAPKFCETNNIILMFPETIPARYPPLTAARRTGRPERVPLC
ncbi:hypothetical protein EVAR_29000_1 [Eumeta japonica]|uniref:Uncharacterized protein n=1 Tax=Eumeta variegata TaxID=151549 RepID=A0A4C1W3Y2_EUMVA|nr:hypothetical protein EVAR_29000_1 [Eumeta japonica]